MKIPSRSILLALGAGLLCLSTTPVQDVGPTKGECCVCVPMCTPKGDLMIGCDCNRIYGGKGCTIEKLTCMTYGCCGERD